MTFDEWFELKKEKCEVYGNGDDFCVDDEIKHFCKMAWDEKEIKENNGIQVYINRQSFGVYETFTR